MATQARRAQGTLLKIDDGGGNFLTIAELTSIELSVEADDLDASNHDTPDAWKEFVPGMKEASADVEGNFLYDASQTALWNAFIDGLGHDFQLITTAVNPFGLQFNGRVMEFSIDAPADEILTFSSTVKISGQPLVL